MINLTSTKQEARIGVALVEVVEEVSQKFGPPPFIT